MNAVIGCVLALAALVGGGILFGWKGVVLALSVIMFWLLLQFSRLMRVMNAAGQAPVGQVDSAVMLQARLKVGMKLVDVLPLSRSLGHKVAEAPPTYRWQDVGGVTLELVLEDGKLARWTLTRPDDAPAAP
ncbi:MAG: hypothetical protein ABW005_11325 [Burkholderiaceae bacterium]